MTTVWRFRSCSLLHSFISLAVLSLISAESPVGFAAGPWYPDYGFCLSCFNFSTSQSDLHQGEKSMANEPWNSLIHSSANNFLFLLIDHHKRRKRLLQLKEGIIFALLKSQPFEKKPTVFRSSRKQFNRDSLNRVKGLLSREGRTYHVQTHTCAKWWVEQPWIDLSYWKNIQHIVSCQFFHFCSRAF